MSPLWKLTIEVEATSYELMRGWCGVAANEVAKAKSFQSIPMGGGGCDGTGSTSGRWCITVSSPIAARITQLRKEADELEKTLK